MRSIGSFARRSFVVRSTHHAVARAVIEAVEPRRMLASVNTLVFEDVNANGRYDTGDVPAAEQTVYADYNYNGNIDLNEPTTRSGILGQVTLLADLRPFALRVAPAFGFRQTAPGTNGASFVEVRDGVLAYYNYQFGVTRTPPPTDASIRLQPFVHVDTNGNGQRDAGESGPAGQTIFADYDYDGVRDADEPGGVTNASGIADFRVASRPFALRLVTAGGSTQVAPANNGPQFFVPGTNGIVGTGLGFSVRSLVPATTSISGTLYDDTNKNGQRDGGEGSVSYDYSFGYYVLYIDLNNNGHPDDNEPTATTRRDAVDSGAYRFDNLPVGRSYTIGFAFSPAATSSLYVTGPGGLSNRRTVAATSAAPTSGVDFGFALGVHVTPLVFPDLNGNGVQDANEPTRFAVNSWLDLNDNGLRDVDEPTPEVSPFNTHGNDVRSYSFNVPYAEPVTYAYADSYAVGTRAVVSRTLSLTSAFANVVLPIPNVTSISGHVFNDVNNNGRLDAGEAGWSGAEIYADYNYNGVPDAGEPLLQANASGDYTIYVRKQGFALRLFTTPGYTVQTSPGNLQPYYYEFRDGALVGYGSDFGITRTT